MVIRPSRPSWRGMLIWELLVAMAILAAVFFPLCLSWLNEQKALRAGYSRAVAIGLVDGEMEILAAGEWRMFPVGVHSYTVQARAVTNLPPGRFLLTINERALRLEWKPDKPFAGGPVWREMMIP
jgi:hypothetical protein